MASDILFRCVISKSRFLDAIALSKSISFKRTLTSAEVATALRPFYFSVHPDLFGQYPSERAVNENSLKVLSSYLETIQGRKPVRPTTLKFYLRPQGNGGRGRFKAVSIELAQRDVRRTVVTILSQCDLPTSYVDKIPVPDIKTRVEEPRYRTTYQEQSPHDDVVYAEKSAKAVKENTTLKTWLSDKASVARVKAAESAAVAEEVGRLEAKLKESLHLAAVAWDCGWNIAHYRGCLQALVALAAHHPDAMGSLEGRTLVFGNDTGLSRDGHILLNSGEVRHNWLDFIKNVHTHEEALKSVPAFEKAVSRVLRDIQVVRRKFQPRTMAKQYENCLRRLTTNLSDYQGNRGYPKQWPKSLENFELVIETEAGPLMLSPTGQFIVPCSCPAFLLVNFISDNLEKAIHLLSQYTNDKDVEVRLIEEAKKNLSLASLSKDDCITPALMIACLENLLRHSNSISQNLVGVHLTITNYYSVMSDGQLCIPWNCRIV